jgi:hypothetical protein
MLGVGDEKREREESERGGVAATRAVRYFNALNIKFSLIPLN